jgi:hypothetical protein
MVVAGSKTIYNISTDVRIACATLAPYLQPFYGDVGDDLLCRFEWKQDITADMRKSVSALAQLCENSAESRTSKFLCAAWEST